MAIVKIIINIGTKIIYMIITEFDATKEKRKSTEMKTYF